MAQRVLVLTNENLADADEVPASLLPLIDEADEIYVVAPTLTTWLQSLATDVDGARVSADRRLHTVFDHMHASGLEARGGVGDENQITAIADALADFDADLIVLRLHVPGGDGHNWREHRLAQRVRSHFDVPTAVLYFDSEGRVVERSEAGTPSPLSSAEGELDAATHDWRDKIASHSIGLRPHLDPSRDHIRGSERPTVTLVEYGDYQSAACVAAARDLAELRTRFDGDLRVAFRHFPIGDAHPLALHAAEVAEAAGAQGRFWEMHDLIYGRDHPLEPALLRKFAERIGLDLERFDSELARDAHLRHILEDFQSGVDSGVNGSPTYFINEERLDGDLDLEALERALERAAVSA
jgi:2-hydroxychromene-2-carboxylate isomerase